MAVHQVRDAQTWANYRGKNHLKGVSLCHCHECEYSWFRFRAGFVPSNGTIARPVTRFAFAFGVCSDLVGKMRSVCDLVRLGRAGLGAMALLLNRMTEERITE